MLRLALVLAIASLCGCGGGTKVSKDSSLSKGKTPTTTKGSRPVVGLRAGDYLCHWSYDTKELKGPCKLYGKKKQRLIIKIDTGLLNGIVTARSFGFEFDGSFKGGGKERAIRAEFLSQGPQAYATVLQLGDGSLLRLRLQAKAL